MHMVGLEQGTPYLGSPELTNSATGLVIQVGERQGRFQHNCHIGNCQQLSTTI
jgi:hypothetical protein